MGVAGPSLEAARLPGCLARGRVPRWRNPAPSDALVVGPDGADAHSVPDDRSGCSGQNPAELFCSFGQGCVVPPVLNSFFQLAHFRVRQFMVTVLDSRHSPEPMSLSALTRHLPVPGVRL